jgi:hypothetical protein
MGLVLAFLTVLLTCAVLCGVLEWVVSPSPLPEHRKGRR